MMKYISTIGTIALMSLFLFPIELKAFPGMNSKKFLAAVGLVWFFDFTWEKIQNRTFSAKIW